jgi:hypothetical protein
VQRRHPPVLGPVAVFGQRLDFFHSFGSLSWWSEMKPPLHNCSFSPKCRLDEEDMSPPFECVKSGDNKLLLLQGKLYVF